MKVITYPFVFIFFSLSFIACKPTNDPPPAGPAVLNSVTTSSGSLSGPKGTIITLRGSNFLTDLSKISVKVNTKNCTVLSASSDSIRATIPVGCGTGSVVLTLDGTILNGPIFNYRYTYTLSSITNGQVGYLDGALQGAKFTEVSGLCIDTFNNCYLNSFNYPIVRKIDMQLQTVSTLAGNGTNGDVNGLGMNARLADADNLSIDDNGTIFYPARQYFKVKKIDKFGNVTTFINNTALQPITVEVVKSGNVYLLSQTGIAKYNSLGTLQWKIESHGYGNVDGDSSVFQLNTISFGNIAIDDQERNLYFASLDYAGAGLVPSQIKKLDLQTLRISTMAGKQDVAGSADGPALNSTFNLITGLALDKFGGLYIGDGFGNKIRYLINGTVSTIVGSNGVGDIDGDVSIAKLTYPDGLRMNKNGELFIACAGTSRPGDTSAKLKRLRIE
jgi:hypothetical protein